MSDIAIRVENLSKQYRIGAPQWRRYGEETQMRVAVEPNVLDEIMRRVVAVARPEKIILFGSAARGEAGPHSDVDLLVVKPDVHRRRLAQAIYLEMIGVGRAVDVIVATPDDLERYRHAPGSVIAPALKEGRVIMSAQRFPPDDPREWLNRARSNLAKARAAAAAQGVYLEDLCFDAQQAAKRPSRLSYCVVAFPMFMTLPSCSRSSSKADQSFHRG